MATTMTEPASTSSQGGSGSDHRQEKKEKKKRKRESEPEVKARQATSTLTATTTTSPSKKQKKKKEKSDDDDPTLNLTSNPPTQGVTHQIQGDVTANANANANLASGWAFNARPDSEFRLVRVKSRIPLAPVFVQDPSEGIRQVMEGWIMRYLQSLDAVLLNFSFPPRFTSRASPLVQSTGFVNLEFEWEGLVWRPRIGAPILGRIIHSYSTPSHISLLIHNMFNASISSDDVPSERYVWDENRKVPEGMVKEGMDLPDLTSGVGGNGVDVDGNGKDVERAGVESEVNVTTEAGEGEGGEVEGSSTPAPLSATYGCWVDRRTDEILGGKDLYLEFNVVGLTIQGSMISVHGSLKPEGPTTSSSTRRTHPHPYPHPASSLQQQRQRQQPRPRTGAEPPPESVIPAHLSSSQIPSKTRSGDIAAEDPEDGHGDGDDDDDGDGEEENVNARRGLVGPPVVETAEAEEGDGGGKERRRKRKKKSDEGEGEGQGEGKKDKKRRKKKEKEPKVEE